MHPLRGSDARTLRCDRTAFHAESALSTPPRLNRKSRAVAPSLSAEGLAHTPPSPCYTLHGSFLADTGRRRKVAEVWGTGFRAGGGRSD